MKIVIPAAGNSRRFKIEGFLTPKFLLPTGARLMIEHVLEMFNVTDEFLLVVNNHDLQEYDEMFTVLKEKYLRLNVIGVAGHDFGPGYTLLNEQVEKFIDNSPFIVSYCDFFVKWNYELFKSFITSTIPDGCVVSFSGLQPASLGSTLFAYLRTRDEQVLEIREKSSFTSDRTSEFASAGIYYFASWQIYVDGFSRLNQELTPNVERYVSLIYNILIEQKFIVNHFEAEKFVCLGTPEDYREYLLWYNYFESNSGPRPLVEYEPEVDISIIPMAGSGQRFIDAGYRLPKPFIPIRELPMFITTIDSIPKSSLYTLIAKHGFQERIALTLNDFRPNLNFEIRTLEHKTAGPGDTLLNFPEDFHSGKSLIISSCDYEHQYSSAKFLETLEDQSLDGLVFTYRFSKFRMRHANAFAYCIADENGKISRIVEKQTISDTPEKDPLVVGTFWFRNSDSLKQALDEAAARDYRVNGEVYVGTSINLLIQRGFNFRCFEVDSWISFGDPFELDLYHWWEELIHEDSNVG
jgi:NDP-sugar pyrophosphorylase family protein